MAMLIEAYGTEGAIALGEKFDYNFISMLLDQTIDLRRDPGDKDKEDIQDWVEQNKERTIEIGTGEAKRAINIASFMAIGNN